MANAGKVEMSEDPYAPPRTTPESNAVGSKTTAPVRLEILKEISTQANASLLWSVVGIFCMGVILGPMSIYRANRALHLIMWHDIGHGHRWKAHAGYVIGIFALIASILMGLMFTLMVLQARKM